MVYKYIVEVVFLPRSNSIQLISEVSEQYELWIDVSKIVKESTYGIVKGGRSLSKEKKTNNSGAHDFLCALDEGLAGLARGKTSRGYSVKADRTGKLKVEKYWNGYIKKCGET